MRAEELQSKVEGRAYAAGGQEPHDDYIPMTGNPVGRGNDGYVSIHRHRGGVATGEVRRGEEGGEREHSHPDTISSVSSNRDRDDSYVRPRVDGNGEGLASSVGDEERRGYDRIRRHHATTDDNIPKDKDGYVKMDDDREPRTEKDRHGYDRICQHRTTKDDDVPKDKDGYVKMDGSGAWEEERQGYDRIRQHHTITDLLKDKGYVKMDGNRGPRTGGPMTGGMRTLSFSRSYPCLSRVGIDFGLGGEERYGYDRIRQHHATDAPDDDIPKDKDGYVKMKGNREGINLTTEREEGGEESHGYDRIHATDATQDIPSDKDGYVKMKGNREGVNLNIRGDGYDRIHQHHTAEDDIAKNKDGYVKMKGSGEGMAITHHAQETRHGYDRVHTHAAATTPTAGSPVKDKDGYIRIDGSRPREKVGTTEGRHSYDRVGEHLVKGRSSGNVQTDQQGEPSRETGKAGHDYDRVGGVGRGAGDREGGRGMQRWGEGGGVATREYPQRRE